MLMEIGWLFKKNTKSYGNMDFMGIAWQFLSNSMPGAWIWFFSTNFPPVLLIAVSQSHSKPIAGWVADTGWPRGATVRALYDRSFRP
jgi:hypothetical protein